MTPEALDRLATLIAAELARVAEATSAPPASPEASARERASPRTPWLPVPVRPEPPIRSTDAPVWSGAAQSLGDIAPVRHPVASSHRASVAETTAAVRGAAAGQRPRQLPRTHGAGSASDAPHLSPATRRQAAVRRDVPIGVSRRHIHLSEAHALALFGVTTLGVHRPLRQPGQFAAQQQVAIVGPSGRIDGLRVVGPARDETQLEMARSDGARLGIDPAVAASGSLDGTSGGVTLLGPNGRVDLARGVIVAARHVHLSVHDGQRWGFGTGDRLDVRCGSGVRAVTWHDVLVRCGVDSATEFHLDQDEANAAGVVTGDTAQIVGWREQRPSRRPLVTERDLIDLVRRHLPIPADAILTPGARDRARALGHDVA